jgi:cell division septation protein DedD
VAPTYYVIELSARWLTILMVALALVMVLAFAFGYGAAWSVLSGLETETPEPARAVAVGSSPTPVVTEEVILSEPTPTRRPTRPKQPTPASAPTTAPPPTRAAPTEVVSENADGFWVQVLASSSPQAMERARDKLEGLGFPAIHQRVTTTQVAGGNVLYKLRVGPFPDHDSADRVARRMRASGYPDAWVVVP